MASAVDAHLIVRLEVEPLGTQLVCTMAQAAAHAAEETVWPRLMQLWAKVLLGCIKESPLILHGRLVLEVAWVIFFVAVFETQETESCLGGIFVDNSPFLARSYK